MSCGLVRAGGLRWTAHRAVRRTAALSRALTACSAHADCWATLLPLVPAAPLFLRAPSRVVRSAAFLRVLLSGASAVCSLVERRAGPPPPLVRRVYHSRRCGRSQLRPASAMLAPPAESAALRRVHSTAQAESRCPLARVSPAPLASGEQGEQLRPFHVSSAREARGVQILTRFGSCLWWCAELPGSLVCPRPPGRFRIVAHVCLECCGRRREGGRPVFL